MNWLNFLHFYQPANQQADILEAIVTQSYRPIFKNFEDYLKGMSLPSWHQWLSYETKFLNRESIIRLVIDSIEYSTNLRERYGLYNKFEADTERSYFVKAGKEIIEVVNQAMSLQDEGEKLERLRSLREYLKNI